MKRDAKRRPTHPGAILREDCLPELGLTQQAFAERLGVSRLTVSELVNEKRGVTPQMAVRLEKVVGSSAETWLGMQQAYDLWQVRHAERETAAA